LKTFVIEGTLTIQKKLILDFTLQTLRKYKKGREVEATNVMIFVRKIGLFSQPTRFL
jgi:hypothetical protein